jgi:hypothetical protein
MNYVNDPHKMKFLSMCDQLLWMSSTGTLNLEDEDNPNVNH